MQQQKKAKLIDTNVILRYLIGDTPEKAERSALLMERFEKDEEKVEVLDVVVAEVIWTLEKFYKVPRKEIAEKLGMLLSFKGIKAFNKSILIRALDTHERKSIDFVNALLASYAEDRHVPVYSFDEDLRKLGIMAQIPR